jgi:hypothetical protein
MEHHETHVVVQVEPQHYVLSSPEDIAKTAVRLTLGEPNPYLERMLTRRIKGEQNLPRIIPIHKLQESESRSMLRNKLFRETKSAQQNSIKALTNAVDLTESSTLHRILTTWVLNAVLDEKLKDREIRENSDCWKYVNGILATILPIITFLIQYYIASHSCTAGSN